MSVASVALLIVVNALADTSISSVFSNPLWRRERIPAGSTYGTGVTRVAGFIPESNSGRLVITAPVTVLHNLADPTDENAYIGSTMLTDMAVLMAPGWWKVAGVNHVLDVPELDPPERIGNVIEYTVTAQLELL